MTARLAGVFFAVVVLFAVVFFAAVLAAGRFAGAVVAGAVTAFFAVVFFAAAGRTGCLIEAGSSRSAVFVTSPKLESLTMTTVTLTNVRGAEALSLGPLMIVGKTPRSGERDKALKTSPTASCSAPGVGLIEVTLMSMPSG